MDPKALHLPDYSESLFDLFHYGWGIALVSNQTVLDRLFHDVIHKWTDPKRYEHTLNNHLMPILTTIVRSVRADSTAFDSVMHLRATILAAFYHDYDYDTTVPDSQNVQESAEAFLRHAKMVYGELYEDAAIQPFVRECLCEIESTDYNASLAGAVPLPFGRSSTCGMICGPNDPVRDGLGLTDFDLMGLGGTYEEFRVHAALVRREWPHVSDHQFRLGRMAFLAKFLRVPRLFHPRMAELEAQACANMGRELASLLEGDPLSFNDLEDAYKLAHGAPLAFSFPLLKGCIKEGEAYVAKVLSRFDEEDGVKVLKAPDIRHHGIPAKKPRKR